MQVLQLLDYCLKHVPVNVLLHLIWPDVDKERQQLKLEDPLLKRIRRRTLLCAVNQFVFNDFIKVNLLVHGIDERVRQADEENQQGVYDPLLALLGQLPAKCNEMLNVCYVECEVDLFFTCLYVL